MATTLNSTAAALLGLLHEGPMTGGELVAAAKERMDPYWSVTRSQVYRELPGLADAGYEAPGRAPGEILLGTEAFEIDGAGRFGEGVDDDRFLLRRELLGHSQLRPVSDRAAPATAGLPLSTSPRNDSEAYAIQQQRALSLLTSTSLRTALDVSREPPTGISPSTKARPSTGRFTSQCAARSWWTSPQTR